MPDVLEAVQMVTDAVEKIKNDGVQHFPIAANIGDAVRQGDVYIQLIDPVTTTPEFFIKVPSPSFPVQLAPGNTKGSRHCLESSEGAEIYLPETALLAQENVTASDDTGEVSLTIKLRQKIDEFATMVASNGEEVTNVSRYKALEINADITDALNFSGPIFVLKNSATVSHPEHGDWVLPPGTYRCVFQRTVDSENTVRRVLD